MRRNYSNNCVMERLGGNRDVTKSIERENNCYEVLRGTWWFLCVIREMLNIYTSCIGLKIHCTVSSACVEPPTCRTGWKCEISLPPLHSFTPQRRPPTARHFRMAIVLSRPGKHPPRDRQMSESKHYDGTKGAGEEKKKGSLRRTCYC